MMAWIRCRMLSRIRFQPSTSLLSIQTPVPSLVYCSNNGAPTIRGLHSTEHMNKQAKNEFSRKDRTIFSRKDRMNKTKQPRTASGREKEDQDLVVARKSVLSKYETQQKTQAVLESEEKSELLYEHFGSAPHLIKYASILDASRYTNPDVTTFKNACKELQKTFKTAKHGHNEIIMYGLDVMDDFGAKQELSAYYELLNIFPVGKYKAQSYLHTEFFPYPKHQNTALFLIEAMDKWRVEPDDHFLTLTVSIFGYRSQPVLRLRRIAYWLAQFRYQDPYEVKQPYPKNEEECAVASLKRLIPKRDSEVNVFYTKALENTSEDTFIVSAQDDEQRELLLKHSMKKPLYIEGPFLMRNYHLPDCKYFTLKSATQDLRKKKLTVLNGGIDVRRFEGVRMVQDQLDMDDILFEEKEGDGLRIKAKRNYVYGYSVKDKDKLPLDLDLELPQHFSDTGSGSKAKALESSIHDQFDGTIFATVITGSSSKESLVSWIRFLEKNSPVLKEITVFFHLRSPNQALVVSGDESAR